MTATIILLSITTVLFLALYISQKEKLKDRESQLDTVRYELECVAERFDKYKNQTKELQGKYIGLKTCLLTHLKKHTDFDHHTETEMPAGYVPKTKTGTFPDIIKSVADQLSSLKTQEELWGKNEEYWKVLRESSDYSLDNHFRISFEADLRQNLIVIDLKKRLSDKYIQLIIELFKLNLLDRTGSFIEGNTMINKIPLLIEKEGVHHNIRLCVTPYIYDDEGDFSRQRTYREIMVEISHKITVITEWLHKVESEAKLNSTVKEVLA
mgnify:CR=1 FL=1